MSNTIMRQQLGLSRPWSIAPEVADLTYLILSVQEIYAEIYYRTDCCVAQPDWDSTSHELVLRFTPRIGARTPFLTTIRVPRKILWERDPHLVDWITTAHANRHRR